MTFFRNLFSSSHAPKSPREGSEARNSQAYGMGSTRGSDTKPVKMSLDERMAFRRELLYETIQVSLNMCNIAMNTYRFKIMRTDKRGHCFLVMLDMSPAFLDSPAGRRENLKEAADLLVKSADTKYGLQVGGVYWRADETLDVNVAKWARPEPRPAPSSIDIEHLSNIEKYEAITRDEMAEFEAAWQNDSAVQIGGRTYSSDLAPLRKQ